MRGAEGLKYIKIKVPTGQQATLVLVAVAPKPCSSDNELLWFTIKNNLVDRIFYYRRSVVDVRDSDLQSLDLG